MKNLFYLFIIFILVACKKQTINITAINLATGKGIPNLHYEILSEKTGWDGEKYKKVAEGTLNENGIALVDLHLKDNRSYLLTLEKPSNACYFEPDYQYTFAKGDKNFNFVYEISTCSNLKLNLKNINCFDENDKMFFRYLPNSKEWNGWSSERLGCYEYVSPNYFKCPSGNFIINWKVTRNGITNEFLDSIYLEENQYYTFSIEY